MLRLRWVLLVALPLIALTACGEEGVADQSGRPASPSSTNESVPPAVEGTPMTSSGCGSSPPPPRQASVVSLGADGKTDWDRPLSPTGDLDSQALPVVADGRVYVAAAGKVQAFDAGSGHVLWSTDAPGTAYGLWRSGSRLVVSLSQVGPNGRILALEPGTGRQMWSYPMPGQGLLGDQLLAGDGLAMVDARGATQLLDLASGRLRWEVPGRSQTYGLGVAGDVVLRAIGGRVSGYSAATGKALWAVDDLPDPAAIHGEPDTVVVSAAATGPSISGDVTGIDARTGRRLWRVHDQDALDWGGGGSAGQLLYRASSGAPEMLLVDTRTGRERWRARTQIALFLPAVVRADTVTTIEGNTSLQRATRLVVRDAATGRVTGGADVTGATGAPHALDPKTTAVLLFQQSPPSPPVVTVMAYGPRGDVAWRGDLPRHTRGVVARGNGGAVALTVDPGYACTTRG